ncbi:hypothetical protein IC232_23150 [Microvirga sp. BT688]|uniref:hypothetical protein n=1 Tax=Microvirga sp. TaxID=1873136 RepID=UPI001687D085|nr:hypothetical protein [Microvirga sp.]MBD2749581.1 hypothetical protein [Microvirga sp.]
MQARAYSAIEILRDRRRVEIRALRPEDRADMLATVGRTSDRSLYRRFFAFKRSFTDQEVDFYVNVDFVSHVALVAVLKEDGHTVIVGGARYMWGCPIRPRLPSPWTTPTRVRASALR